jgi:DNA-binding transcriptional ArsR family regulator
MEKKYVLLSIEDSKIGALSKVLGNKTCKKIIDSLAEKEASEKDIAESLKIPINTVEYNLKQLIDSGLVEKSKNFFWSKKGKKVSMYKLSNKSIIISPKTKVVSKFKPLLPVAIISIIGAFLIRQFYISKGIVEHAAETSTTALKSGVAESMIQTAAPQTNYLSNSISQTPLIWIWFLAGAFFSLILFLILNWRKL